MFPLCQPCSTPTFCFPSVSFGIHPIRILCRPLRRSHQVCFSRSCKVYRRFHSCLHPTIRSNYLIPSFPKHPPLSQRRRTKPRIHHSFCLLPNRLYPTYPKAKCDYCNDSISRNYILSKLICHRKSIQQRYL